MNVQPVILSALKDELAAVRAGIPRAEHARVRLERGGVGWASASGATSRILQTATPSWMCSTGFCGGLSDDLSVGDIVLATKLCADDAQAFELDATIVTRLSSALQAAGVRFRAGAIAGVREPVSTCEQKRALGQRRGCIAVDMESCAMAQTAAGRCPVLAIRAVSDSVDDALPPEIAGFLNAAGNVRIGNVAKFALGGPSRIRTLLDLGARSRKAAAALTAAWRAAWPVLVDLPGSFKSPDSEPRA